MAKVNWYQNSDYKCNNDKRPEPQICLCSLADIQLRFLCPSDLNEVRALCEEWFPIEYPLSWYEQITSSQRFYALAAIYNSIIIGLIVAEIRPCKTLNPEDATILAKAFVDADVGYILSLGVAKRYRRNGIATLLLDSLINHLTMTDRRKVKAIFLHVLTTNSAAILFYEHWDFYQRFRLHTFLPYYYSIDGRCRDGFTYVLYVNGGHPPWSAYDYMKFVCGTILKGGGLFSWLLTKASVAMSWVWTGRFRRRQHLEG